MATSIKHIVDSIKRNPEYGYNGRIDNIRRKEYSHLGDTIYLDHAGATIYPASIVHDHCYDLTVNLFSNPHSQSPSSIATEHRVNSVRERVLQTFNADPEVFDLVFVANATAGIKLIADGFSGSPKGFRYKYLQDSHTSLLGASQLSAEHNSITEAEANKWLSGGSSMEKEKGKLPGLFAYPAQSNLTGQRFTLDWIVRLRDNFPGWYSLLDASSYLTTTPLDYSDSDSAPDFTTFSFYKIYGFPDLGGVIVRKSAAHMLIQRRFYGGGTREAMNVEAWARPREVVHEALEDGTLPFHSILALESALNNYIRLFGAHIFVARHAAQVTRLAYVLLSSLRHANGRKVCEIYSRINHGPIITFNIVTESGSQIGFKSFETLAAQRNFAVRTGGMCNPGGMQKCLNLRLGDVNRIFENGKICGDDQDIIEGKNFGMIRISFGASTTVEEVCAFVDFVRECYMDRKRKLFLWMQLRRGNKSMEELADGISLMELQPHKHMNM